MQHFVYRIEDINGTGPYRGKTSVADSWINKTICNHSAKNVQVQVAVKLCLN